MYSKYDDYSHEAHRFFRSRLVGRLRLRPEGSGSRDGAHRASVKEVVMGLDVLFLLGGGFLGFKLKKWLS